MKTKSSKGAHKDGKRRCECHDDHLQHIQKSRNDINRFNHNLQYSTLNETHSETLQIEERSIYSHLYQNQPTTELNYVQSPQ